ncbi:MAG: hypothetical protein QF781_09255 [Phycisphaerales bacterium]|jgi:hypothetical protein|nr:hypothetical protein [Phycisphaerales bacterium]MDP7519575.1 hypothetical protein [Phycisphaerales bacterium]|tara:strand:+ start:1300 stop:1494 length:195 start_codon:yes stop_codon:yes gene_type:complete
MRNWVNTWKRPAMGWVGIAGILAALLWEPADPTARFIAIAISIALICLALSPRAWTNIRSWWTD